MKALTICQPYAELIARGEKRIENRTWPTQFRGTLFIHAGKSRSWMDVDDARQYPGMAFGALIATAHVVDCVHISDPRPEWQARFENDPHANGPWCWILDQVHRIEPFPFRGAQGLFDVPNDVALTMMPQRTVMAGGWVKSARRSPP